MVFLLTLRRNIRVRKELEHGTMKNLSGAEVDRLVKDAQKFLKRLNELFKDIEKRKEEEGVVHTYDSLVTAVRDVLRIEGFQRVKETELEKLFAKNVIEKGILPERFLRVLKELFQAKADYDAGKLNKADIQKLQRDSRDLLRALIEYIQRKRGAELERTRIRVKHGDKFGEVWLLGKKAFIIHDIDADDKNIAKADVTPTGSLANIQASSLEEYEQALADTGIPERTFIKEPIFEDLKSLFGKDVEILLNY